MGGYLPTTAEDRAAMLRRVGADSPRALYEAVPEEILYPKLDLPEGLSELQLAREMQALAAQNRVYGAIFRGAGAYNHYIPAIVKAVTSKEEFVTAYTPYQAEISQGILQSIFEYQTMICELTGMDAANASVYDGATAACEAANMCRDKRRGEAVFSACAHPMTLQTARTYAHGAGTGLAIAPEGNGRTDLSQLRAMVGPQTACVLIQQPNFYGQWEDVAAAAEIAHAAGAKLIVAVNPIFCALFEAPGALGADICVGEGQPLGLPLSFGGPYLGFMACKRSLLRKLPGRIVGETTDGQNRRAFVLTLQAREQHIRREKAMSNICSNEALCAMTAAAYLTAMGPRGLAEAARQCYAKAHYLRDRLSEIGYAPRHEGEFFHEFVTEAPHGARAALDALSAQGILGGLPVAGGLLWCATEMNDRAQIDQLIAALKEVRA